MLEEQVPPKAKTPAHTKTGSGRDCGGGGDREPHMYVLVLKDGRETSAVRFLRCF